MIRVVCSGAFAPAYRLLVPRFEAASGATVESQWGPSMGEAANAVPNRLARGEDIDVVIMSGPALDQMQVLGYVAERLDLARSLIGVAVRAGAPVPDISTPEALRETLLAAASIGHSVSASGAYVRDTLFDLLGIRAAVSTKTRVAAGEPVGELVARGEVEIGFQQMSELQPIAGITVAGPLPEAVQQVTIFAAGRVTASKNPEGARRLMRYLASAEAAPVIAASGMEPAGMM